MKCVNFGGDVLFGWWRCVKSGGANVLVGANVLAGAYVLGGANVRGGLMSFNQNYPPPNQILKDFQDGHCTDVHI